MRSPLALPLMLVGFCLSLSSPAWAQDVTLLPPALEVAAEAPYPEEAKRAGLEGAVELELVIGLDGHVTKASVVRSAGHGFDEAALAAGESFVFRPALRGGKPVVAKIRYTYSFRLERKDPPPPPSEAPDEESALPSAEPAAPAPGAAEATSDDEVPEEIEVRGEKEEREVPVRSLGREALRTMPGVNGDPLRAVTSLPGIARPPGFSDLFIVRGSSPAGSAAFLDGAFVPRPYHFGGLASVVPAELVDRIDFFPGNAAARYGRVDGGVVNIVTRSPSTDRHHAVGQIDLFDARLFAEGPVPGFRSWSFALGARRSWLDAWLGPVLESGGVSARTVPYYYDGQLFLETHPSSTSTLRIGMYTATDTMRIGVGKLADDDPSVAGGVANTSKFSRFQINYSGEWSKRTKASAMISVGSDDGDTRVGSVLAVSRVDIVSSRAEVAHELSSALTLRGGLDILAATVDLDLSVPKDPRPGQADPPPLVGQRFVRFDERGIVAARPAAFVDAVWTPTSALTLTPGLRADYTYEVGETTLSPRLNGRLVLRRGATGTALRGGIGIYRQSIDYNYVASAFGTSNLQSGRSVQGSLGVEQGLGEGSDVSLESFVKKLDNLVSHDAARGGPEANANDGRGQVVGLELLLKRRPSSHSRFAGFLAYTLSRSTRVDAPGQAERLFEYDQTHVLTAVGSVRLGRGFSLGGRFRYASGNPYTPCLGGSLSADAGLYGCVQGPPMSARVPAFAQFDVRLEKSWEFAQWKLSAYLDVQNTTNRSNPEQPLEKFDKSQRAYQPGLPILPIVGLRGEL
jgi:TonB family protein